MSTKNIRKKRMHGIIKDPQLQEQIRKVMEERNCTFEQLVKREINFSKDPDNDIHLQYQEIESSIFRRYKKQNLVVLMELFWDYTLNAAKGKYDLDKLLNDITADIDIGTYKNRTFVEEKSLAPPGKESAREFLSKWDRITSEILSAKKPRE